MGIEWQDSYRIGNTEIDTQHEQWFASISSFLEAQDKEALQLCEMQMYRYTRLHFAFEENLMRSVHYPEIRAHVDQHNALLTKLNEIAARIADETLDRAHWKTFLTGWLLHHIAAVDTQLATYVAAADQQ
jgi:hemerythrin